MRERMIQLQDSVLHLANFQFIAEVIKYYMNFPQLLHNTISEQPKVKLSPKND